MAQGQPTTAETSLALLAEWFTPKRFAALLALLIAAAYPDILFLGRSFFFRDYAFFGYPLAAYHRELFWRGELPFWNPYNDCGLPFLAQWNTLTLYPGSLLYLLLPLPWSLGFFCLVHLFLAGLGMYWLAWKWTNHSAAAAVAGLAYAFNGLTLTCLMWPNNIASLGWLPWTVGLVVLAVQQGGRRRVALAALVAALQVLSGGPEIILLTWVLIGAVLVFTSNATLRDIIPQTRRSVILGALVVGLVAVQMLPFAELLSHSQRDRSWAGANWSMPLWGWLNLFVAHFGSKESFHGVYSQPGQGWSNSYYPGMLITALALLAAWRVRDRRVWCLCLLGAGGLALAQGGEGLVYGPLRKALPVLGFIRFPVKYVVLTLMVLPLLAAFGFRHWCSIPARQMRREGLLGAAWLLLIVGLATWLDHYLQTDRVRWQETLACGAKSLAWYGVAVGLIFWLQRTATPARLLVTCGGVFLVIWIDALTFGVRPNPSVESWVYDPDSVRTALKLPADLGLGGSRIRGSVQAQESMDALPDLSPSDLITYCRLGLFENLNLLDHAPRITGFYSLTLRDYDQILPWFYTRPEARMRTFLEFTGVSYTQPPGKSAEWTKRWTPLPLITAGQMPVPLLDEDEIHQRLASGRFAPRIEVYLPKELATAVAGISNTTARVENVAWQEQSAQFSVTAEHPAMVVIAQAYYPAWEATVDGQPVPLWRANHAFTALAVPSGTHAVRLFYRDHAFQRGLVISVLTLLVTMGLLLPPRRRHGAG